MLSVLGPDVEISNYPDDNTIMCVGDDYLEVKQKLNTNAGFLCDLEILSGHAGRPVVRKPTPHTNHFFDRNSWL